MGWDEDPETAAEIAYQVRLIFNYFHSKPVYSYERILGKGSYGVACLLREVRNEVLLQKFVVKRSILGHGDGSIKNEAKVLDWLAGAPHIVKKIALSKTEDVERYLSGPTLITEYLRNGTLARFILRLEDTPEKIPNRLLWRIFLCLIRGCIALAYPPSWPNNASLTPEILPENKDQNIQIVHNDIHSENVAFGDFLENGAHDLCPILKMIDFGYSLTFDLKNKDEALLYRIRDFDRENIFEIGKLMLDLIYKRDSALQDGDDTQTIHYGGGTCNTFAIELFHRNGTTTMDASLDKDLAILVARCVSDNKNTQPSLQELVGKVSEAVRIKSSDRYPGRPAETDEEIKSLVKRLILEPEFIDREIFADYEIADDQIDG